MYIADRADRRARICAALTPDGVLLNDLVPVSGMCRENCGALLRQMAKAGMVWSARGKLGTDEAEVRYFPTEASRDAWVSSYLEIRAARLKEQRRQERQRQVDPAIAARIAANKALRKQMAEKREQERIQRKAERDAARIASKSAEAAEARKAKDRERKRIKAAKKQVARMPGRKQIAVAQMLYRIRDQEVREAAEKRARRDDRPVVIPAHVKPQIIKTQPGRFEVVGEITGGFGALKPGQYAFEPSSCAAKAAA
ncbi:hypothetical protein J7U46_09665 [Pelomonas sp. V22]|uniref:hypothetical protein n=1 Tax=Pelomonas sp. V22 TaxID=2822139 RepID=UPI0024A9463D|nr:hypothetical protein [Pelomonas sp. V22]MDI4633313.1 hypothetical protein [Pelomonas sp. V22]